MSDYLGLAIEAHNDKNLKRARRLLMQACSTTGYKRQSEAMAYLHVLYCEGGWCLQRSWRNPLDSECGNARKRYNIGPKGYNETYHTQHTQRVEEVTALAESGHACAQLELARYHYRETSRAQCNFWAEKACSNGLLCAYQYINAWNYGDPGNELVSDGIFYFVKDQMERGNFANVARVNFSGGHTSRFYHHEQVFAFIKKARFGTYQNPDQRRRVQFVLGYHIGACKTYYKELHRVKFVMASIKLHRKIAVKGPQEWLCMGRRLGVCKDVIGVIFDMITNFYNDCVNDPYSWPCLQ